MPPRGLPSHVVGQPCLPGYLLRTPRQAQRTASKRMDSVLKSTHQFSGDIPVLSVAERGIGFRAHVDPAGLTPSVTKVPLMYEMSEPLL